MTRFVGTIADICLYSYKIDKYHVASYMGRLHSLFCCLKKLVVSWKYRNFLLKYMLSSKYDQNDQYDHMI